MERGSPAIDGGEESGPPLLRRRPLSTACTGPWQEQLRSKARCNEMAQLASGKVILFH